tara:strand:- start:1262 stop:1606 length:345 start_codon:yes stop_codon:yes gene_type:complete
MAFTQERQSDKLPQLGDSYKNADAWPPKKKKKCDKYGCGNPSGSSKKKPVISGKDKAIIAGTALTLDVHSQKNQQAFIDAGHRDKNKAQGDRQYKGLTKFYFKNRIKQIGELFQ